MVVGCSQIPSLVIGNCLSPSASERLINNKKLGINLSLVLIQRLKLESKITINPVQETQEPDEC